MIEFEFEWNVAIVEALDAAGVDDQVPSHGIADADAGEAKDSPGP